MTEFEIGKHIVSTINDLRLANFFDPSTKGKLIVDDGTGKFDVEMYREIIERDANIGEIVIAERPLPDKAYPCVYVGETVLFIDFEYGENTSMKLARLEREKAHVMKIAESRKKLLSNKSFQMAPENVRKHTELEYERSLNRLKSIDLLIDYNREIYTEEHELEVTKGVLAGMRRQIVNKKWLSQAEESDVDALQTRINCAELKIKYLENKLNKKK